MCVCVCVLCTFSCKYVCNSSSVLCACFSQSLQSEVLDEMTAAIEGTEMEGNKLILADILLERAQLVRQLGSSTNEQ